MNIISSRFLPVRFLFFILLSSAFFSAHLYSDEWLDQFIKYTDNGKTLRYFPRFHEGTWTVPEGVEKIGRGAFAQCLYITELNLPSSLKEIDEKAFYFCYGLESLSIPEGVEKIGDSAFYRCESLETISIPQSVKEIGINAFYESGITSLTVPGREVKLGSSLVSNCGKLEKADLRYAAEIGDYAFEDCDSLKEVYLPEGIYYSNLAIPATAALHLVSPDGIHRGITAYSTIEKEIDDDRSYAERLIKRNNSPVKALPGEEEITRKDIQGSWFADYRNGEYISPGGSGRLGFFGPNTGDSGTCFIFNRDNTCVTGVFASGASSGGTYEVGDKQIDCKMVSYAVDEDAEYDGPQYYYNTFIPVLLDKTHLQLEDRENGYWYICSLHDEELRETLLNDTTARAFKILVLGKQYLGCTFASEETLLMQAVKQTNPAAVEWLLGNMKQDINAQNMYGMTALHYAMRYKEDNEDTQRILDLLLENGAEVNQLDDYGQTPLDYSLYDYPASYYNENLRRALAEAGGKSSRQRWAQHMTRQDF